MVTCDNCFKAASYTCADPGVNPVNYCASCLPVWLHARANAGHFPLVEPIKETPPVETEKETVDEPTKAAPKTTAKKKTSKSNE